MRFPHWIQAAIILRLVMKSIRGPSPYVVLYFEPGGEVIMMTNILRYHAEPLPLCGEWCVVKRKHVSLKLAIRNSPSVS